MPDFNYSKLKETKVKSKIIHRGVVGFNIDTVRLINGKTATREFMVHPGASAVLPVIDGKVVLVEQYRYPVGSVMLEIPAGKKEKGQTPLSCAKAELEQETGFKAAKFKKLLSFNPASAFSDEVLHIFLATGLKPGKKHLDSDEFLNVKTLPLQTAYKYVKAGKIRDSKTIIALLLYKAYGGR
jgi:ADP-ribose pyrophosphatase